MLGFINDFFITGLPRLVLNFLADEVIIWLQKFSSADFNFTSGILNTRHPANICQVLNVNLHLKKTYFI